MKSATASKSEEVDFACRDVSLLTWRSIAYDIQVQSGLKLACLHGITPEDAENVLFSFWCLRCLQWPDFFHTVKSVLIRNHFNSPHKSRTVSQQIHS